MDMKQLKALAARNSRIAMAKSQQNGLGRPLTSHKLLVELPVELRNRQLHTAVDNGDYKLAELTLNAKADPNSRIDGWSAMDRATYLRDRGGVAERSVYERIAALLVARGATPEKSAEDRARELLRAIDEADYNGALVVLGRRMDLDTVVDGWTALGRVNHLIETEEDKEIGQRRSVFTDNLVDIRQMLVEKGAEKDSRGEPTGAAPQKSMPAERRTTMERSFEDECEINAAITLKKVKELHRLIRMEPEIAKIEAHVCDLIRSGGNLDEAVNGWTALGISGGRGLKEVSRLLERYGAMKNLQLSRAHGVANARELVKAIWTARSEDMALDTARGILGKGLNPYTTVDGTGLNALNVANHRGFTSLGRLLKEYAAERVRQGE